MPRYRPPSSEPRGKWARAIHAKRRAEQISQTAAFEVLGPRLGLGPKSRSAYIALDMGEREPSEAEANVLAEWLGSYPVEEPHTAGTGPHTSDFVPAAYLDRIDKLVEQLALDRALIRDLVDELRLARAEAAGYAAAVRELGTRGHEAPEGGHVDEPPAGAQPSSNHPDR